MEWLKELLKKLGIADTEIDKIDTEVRKELPKHFVPKSQYNDVSEARKQAEEALAERDKQLENLKKDAGDNAELKQQIETLQAENKTAKERYESDMKDLRLNTAIKLAVAADAHDPDLVTGLVEKDKLLITDDGKVSGLDDQLKALRESKAFLFVEKDEDGKPRFKGAKPPESGDKGGGGHKNPWSREHFNLTEQGKILRENPELAKQLQAAAK